MFYHKKSKRKFYNILVVFLTMFYSLFGMYPFQNIQEAHAYVATDYTATQLLVQPARDGTGNVTVGVTFQNTSTTAPGLGQYMGAKYVWDITDCVTSTYQGAGVSSGPTTTMSIVTSSIGQPGTPVITPSGQAGYTMAQVSSTLATANRVTTTWFSGIDIPTANGTYCLFVNANVSQHTGNVVSTTFTLDNVAPTTATALTVGTRYTTSTVLNIGAAVSETNFQEYKIYWKLGTSGVTPQNSTAFTSSSDTNLGVNSTSAPRVTGLATSTQYVANIWAYDTYGNISPTSTAISFSTAADVAGIPTLGSAATSTIGVSFGTDTNPTASTTYAIYNAISNNYVGSDGTSSATAVYQATSTWGSTVTARGLSPSVGYQFQIVARNNDGVDAATSTVSATLKTLPNPASALTIGTPTSTTALPLTINVNGNSTSTLYAIFNTTTLNYLSSNGNSSASPIYQTTSTWGINLSAYALSVNTAYKFSVIASSDGTSIYAATSTDSALVYTLASVPNTAATVTSTATTTLSVKLGANNGATTYLVYDSVASKFLQTNGTWGSTTSTGWITYAGLGGGTVVTSTTGLTANSSHTIKVFGRNGDGVDTVASAGLSSYTLASVPNAVATVTSTASSTLDITLGSDNGATTYLVYDSVTSKFLQTNGTWGSTTSTGWITYAGLGGGTTATSTTGLTANTQHTIKVFARNGDGMDTAVSSGVSSYTMASTPVAATVNGATISALNVALNSSDATDYAVRFTAGSTVKYLQTDGTLGNSVAYISYTGLGGGSATTTSGLSANTSYIVAVAGRNVDTSLTPYTSSTAVYTLANTPTASASASGSTITLTISGDSSEQFYVSYSGGTSDYSTSQTRTFSGLTCSTAYTFTVTGRNGDSVTTGTATASATTGGCSGGGTAPGSGSTAPATPAPAPVIPVAPVVLILVLNQPTLVLIGGVSHTATVSAATEAQVTLTIQSEPIKLTLNNGESKDIDTNKDSINDVRVTYYGLVNGKPKLEFVNLTDPNEIKNAVTINAGSYQTDSRSVVLTLQSNNVEKMAVSNASDFVGSSFEPFVKTLNWALVEGNGTKTVYVKFRSKDGGVSSASDSIVLTGSSSVPITPSVQQIPVLETLVQFSNPNSGIVFRNLNTNAEQGSSFNYTYRFANATAKAIKIKTVKQLVNQKGKIVSTASTKFVTLKPHDSLELKGVQTLGKTLAIGNYTVNVQIVDTKGKVIDQNSYTVTVEKLKNKVVNITGGNSTGSNVSFDKATFGKVSSAQRQTPPLPPLIGEENAFLPASLKLKYSYVNTTKVKQQIKVERELVNSDGKVLQTSSGKWTMKAGEKYSKNVVQTLNKTLNVGDYTLSIKAFDAKTGTLLDEGWLKLSIAEK